MLGLPSPGAVVPLTGFRACGGPMRLCQVVIIVLVVQFEKDSCRSEKFRGARWLEVGGKVRGDSEGKV